jgi:hypothetical protein
MISVPKHVYVVGLVDESKYCHYTCRRNIEALSRNHCCHVKELLRILSVCL